MSTACCRQTQTTMWGQPAEQDFCAPDSADFDISVFEIGDFTDMVTMSASGVPAGLNLRCGDIGSFHA